MSNIRRDHYGGPGLDGSPSAHDGHNFEDLFNGTEMPADFVGQDPSTVLAGLDLDTLSLNHDFLLSLNPDSLGGISQGILESLTNSSTMPIEGLGDAIEGAANVGSDFLDSLFDILSSIF